jgi:DNA-binding IclR family transcriptional regulator
MTAPGSGKTIKSDETLFGVVEAVRAAENGTLGEIAARMEVSKSTVYRHLATLEKHRYVAREGDTYRLGLRFLDLGGYVRDRNPLYKRAKGLVVDVADRTGEFAGFLVEEHGLGMYLYSETGTDGVGNDVRVGRQIHLHQSAAGKAILANLPEARVDEIVDEYGLPARTEHTLTDRESLREELARVRQSGHAYARGDHTEGLWAVGVPVHDPAGTLAGALIVAGPTHRMRGEWFEDELPESLKGAVKEFELNLSYS